MLIDLGNLRTGGSSVPRYKFVGENGNGHKDRGAYRTSEAETVIAFRPSALDAKRSHSIFGI